MHWRVVKIRVHCCLEKRRGVNNARIGRNACIGSVLSVIHRDIGPGREERWEQERLIKILKK